MTAVQERPTSAELRVLTTKTCEHGEVYPRCPHCASVAKANGGRPAELWLMTRACSNCDKRFPRRYVDAEADHPEVIAWAQRYADDRRDSPSLLIVGPTGVGKTYQAYGALRYAVTSPEQVDWQASTFADFTAALRPSGSDPEGSMRKFRDADLLLIDDLGAAKHSEWVEETSYRLINGRYEDMRPSIFTTNLPLKELREALGDRIASRLVETCVRVSLSGGDRRRKQA